MIVVQLVGGLGNQMFGYALYRALKENNRNVKIDLSFFRNQTDPNLSIREVELEKVFGVKINEISVLQRIINHIEIKIGWMKIYTDKRNGFQPEVLNIHRGVLSGYWQSFQYFEQIFDIIRKEFSFKYPLNVQSKQIIEKIRNSNSVSISVRRGDYLNVGYVLPVDYYNNAMQYMKENVQDAVFYCTSDDIEWCKRTWGDKMIYIDWLDDESQYFGMQVISECKHNIVGNSTYSLWGAWLNNNINKIVIRPRKWFKDSDEEKKDFWPENWIVIES